MPRTNKPAIVIGASCLALVGSLFLVTARAQQPAVAIDNDDIGGVVTSANGPEAGVWVIAESRDLGVRYIKAVVTDDRGPTSFPICQRLITAWGHAATDWSMVRRPQAFRKLVNLTATIAPTTRQPRSTTRDLLVLDAAHSGSR